MPLPERIWVKITPEHYNEGQRESYYDCPLALAILAMLPKIDHVRVSSGWAVLYDARERKLGMYALPIEAGFFAFEFDHGFGPPLIEFEMTLA